MLENTEGGKIKTMDKIIPQLNEKLPSIAFLTAEENAFLETYSPETALIIYGTLAPNAPNHHIVEHINGSWQQGIVRGKLRQYGWGADLGYFAFQHTPEGEAATAIKAHVLLSKELPANWAYLDEFEGEGYKRILAKYELDNGQIGVGFIYAMNETAENIENTGSGSDS
jgi:gamma-glutamylcyclotransferase (GGCT)/AIG2-like uncharacterized protein YtfP